jgi:hypothetical protein
MKTLLLCGCLVTCVANATTITYNFGSGMGVNSPVWPASSGSGNTGTVSLGTTILLLDDPNSGGLTSAVTLTASGNLVCVASQSVPGACAATATANEPGNTHAAGLGIGDARINGSESLTITVNPGYTATLLSFAVTALYDVTGEQLAYNAGSGPIVLSATGAAIDLYDVPNTAFTTLIFTAPAQGGSVANTYALYSLTLDIEGTALPEPGTMSLVGAGLLALSLLAGRRRKPD